jgi:hypothetical protein
MNHGFRLQAMRAVGALTLLLCACSGAAKHAATNTSASNVGVVGPGAARTVSATPAPTAAPSGQSQTVGALSVTLHGDRVIAPTAASRPPSGDEWLALAVTVQNNGDQPFPLAAYLAFTLLDHAGHSYQPSPPATDLGLQGKLNGAIPPGGSLDGEVLFAPSKADAPFTLRFASPLGGGFATWTVPGA